MEETEWLCILGKYIDELEIGNQERYRLGDSFCVSVRERGRENEGREEDGVASDE